MIVTKSGWSPATNAYRSVLSTDGSAEISGASRWLEATEEPGTRTSTAAINNVAPAAASTPLVRRRRVSGGASAMPAPFPSPTRAGFREGFAGISSGVQRSAITQVILVRTAQRLRLSGPVARL